MRQAIPCTREYSFIRNKYSNNKENNTIKIYSVLYKCFVYVYASLFFCLYTASYIVKYF